jgi:hypothetical protein
VCIAGADLKGSLVWRKLPVGLNPIQMISTGYAPNAKIREESVIGAEQSGI